MPGTEPRRSSTQPLHSRPASTTASHQSSAPAGGHCTPAGGDNAKRKASERSSSTLVSANMSGGHASSSSVNPPPLIVCHADASVSRRSPAPLCPAIPLIRVPVYVIGRSISAYSRKQPFVCRRRGSRRHERDVSTVHATLRTHVPRRRHGPVRDR